MFIQVVNLNAGKQVAVNVNHIVRITESTKETCYISDSSTLNPVHANISLDAVLLLINNA